MNVHKKKYFILFTPLLIIGIFLLFILPAEQRLYVYMLPPIFWLIYYAWIFIERKQREKQ